MPTSSMDGVTDETHLEAWDATCGIFTAGPASAMAQRVTAHFADAHPERAVVVEGVDFTIEPGPWRCDACNTAAEPPWWSHVCSPPLDTETTIDNDGLWLLCDPCHVDIEMGALGGLVARAMEVCDRTSPGRYRHLGGPAKMRRYYARHFARLAPRLDPGTRRTDVSL